MPNYEFEYIENFRDFAAYPCRYGEMTKGVIFRSASISYATEKDIKSLLSLGIRSEIDLRGARMWVKLPSPLKERGVEVVEIEIPFSDRFATKEEDVPSWYLNLASDPYCVRKLCQAIIRLPKPLLLHCDAGKDRTGTFGTLLLLANGVSCKDAADSYNESYRGHLSKTEMRTKEKYPDLPDYVFHMNEGTIEKFLALFYEKYGSIEEYLECMGLNDSEIDALSNIFGKQETSAGAVTFHGNNVLVEHMKMGHYSMPKGHVEECDLNLEETAIREIREETGLDATILDGFHKESVFSPRPGAIKRVHWFVATVDDEKTIVQPEEVSEIYFLSPADALRVLTHDSDREILTAACNFYFK